MKLLITEAQYKLLSNPIVSNDINEKLPLIKSFVDFCSEHLSLSDAIKVHLTNKKNKTRTFAHYSSLDNSLTVYVKNRHIGDVLRSIAHELKHSEQNSKGTLKLSSGEDGSPEENEANSFAGIMMRKFGRLHPDIYE